MNQSRFLFHSFPRPRKDEPMPDVIARGLRVLSFMNEIGLVLAPELVKWDVAAISGGQEHLEFLQKRACFTELAANELPEHAKTFGPFSLVCDIEKLRNSGASPVIYAPQGGENALSQISTFAVRGAYHTRYVINKFRQLRDVSNPATMAAAAAQLGVPVAADPVITMNNVDGDGNAVESVNVPASHIRALMNYVGFRSRPLDHIVAALDIFLNAFYQTDNPHSGELLGYYRQREWRLVGANLKVNGRDIARDLTDPEQKKLVEVDEMFWAKNLEIDGKKHSRASLAILYQPTDGWSIWDAVDKVLVPPETEANARKMLGDKVITALEGAKT